MMNRLFLFSILLALCSCSPEPDKPRAEYNGYAQGTTWRVILLQEEIEGLDQELKRLFVEVDASMSLYIDSSLISQFNRSETSGRIDPLFKEVLDESARVYQATNGSFDPTVGPLVAAWGFHRENYAALDSLTVDSLMESVGLSGLSWNDTMIMKSVTTTQLDFNAIAQGYTVDLIVEKLDRMNVPNYLVEVGGEVRVKGMNQEANPWRIGIDHPDSEAQSFSAIVGLKDVSLATSGNYRKFFVDEETGMRYAHTIDPKTGFPIRNNLLSVSVIAEDCIAADAYATAFMVMGVKETKKWLENHPGMEVFLMYSGKNGDLEEWMTPGFDQAVID